MSVSSARNWITVGGGLPVQRRVGRQQAQRPARPAASGSSASRPAAAPGPGSPRSPGRPRIRSLEVGRGLRAGRRSRRRTLFRMSLSWPSAVARVQPARACLAGAGRAGPKASDVVGDVGAHPVRCVAVSARWRTRPAGSEIAREVLHALLQVLERAAVERLADPRGDRSPTSPAMRLACAVSWPMSGRVAPGQLRRRGLLRFDQRARSVGIDPAAARWERCSASTRRTDWPERRSRPACAAARPRGRC